MTTQQIRNYPDSLAKPPGSLGRLEDLAARLCEVQQTLAPRTRPRRDVLFAADHGVVAEGVSAWPSAVTGHMIRTIVAGRQCSLGQRDSDATAWGRCRFAGRTARPATELQKCQSSPRHTQPGSRTGHDGG